MIKHTSLAIGALVALSLVACQSMEHGTGQKASASLDSRSGSNAKGTVNFVWQGHDVLVTGTFSGLKPNAEQGFHVHEKGDCSAADAMMRRPVYIRSIACASPIRRGSVKLIPNPG